MTQQRKKCGKGGFTLVELVVTLVILSILFAIAVPNLLGYIHLSQFRRNESCAKTMYLSAESALTYCRTGGEWESFCRRVKDEGVLNRSFDEADGEQKKLSGRIYGIRLDAADVLDFDFMRGLRRLANEVKPEFWLMGEVIHGDYSRWANPEMLHSVTNYELHKGLWSGHNDHNYFEIAHTMRRLQGLCHDTRLYLFSDNHDVERLPNKLRNREHIRHIAILVYSLWGIPSIYYGSEFGIEGKKEWGSDWPLRPCLELSDYADAERTNPVTSVYKALGKCKAELPEMTYGEVKELQLTTQCYAFARVLDGKAVVAVLNNGDTPAQLEFQLPVEAAKVTDLLADTVGAQEVLVSTEWNRMKVQLPSNYATLLRLE